MLAWWVFRLLHLPHGAWHMLDVTHLMNYGEFGSILGIHLWPAAMEKNWERLMNMGGARQRCPMRNIPGWIVQAAQLVIA